MPELPEVSVVVKTLNRYLKNKTIKDITISKEKLIKEVSPMIFKKKLKNQTIALVDRYAKFIIFKFKDDLIMLSHLRMEGKYFYFKNKTKPMNHVHVVFKFTDGSELHYMDTRVFGTFHLRTNEDYLITLPLSKLAPEPKDYDAKELYKKLQKKNIAIKTALLDQTIIAGLGNIYVDEVLFDNKINPNRGAFSITLKQCEDIIKSSERIFNHSISLGGSSINSYTSVNAKEGGYQNYLKVHTKKGEMCSRCKTPITKTVVGGRGTYYCKNCQK